LVIGHWSLVIGHWSLVIGHWSLVIGHWSLVIGHWSLVIGIRMIGIRKYSRVAAHTGSNTTLLAGKHRTPPPPDVDQDSDSSTCIASPLMPPLGWSPKTASPCSRRCMLTDPPLWAAGLGGCCAVRLLRVAPSEIWRLTVANLPWHFWMDRVLVFNTKAF
jgi:hypothetical protein